MTHPKPILLISGPSGGGKSTLIQQLAEGTLDSEILSLLPEGCGAWPMIEANDLLKGDLTIDAIPDHAAGLMMHYDMVFIHRGTIRRYEDDPSLQPLLKAGQRHMIFLKPDIEQVRRQFLERHARQQAGKSAISKCWSRCFRLPMRRLLARFKNKPLHKTESIYQDHKWLAACYAQWEGFLRNQVDQHPDSQLIVIEPASNDGRHPRFRLVCSTGASHSP